MPRGISLHIGLNRVDPSQYQDEAGRPWSGLLNGCESDASAMRDIAQSQGFAPTTLLTTSATSEAVLEAIAATSEALEREDFFFLTYSGHGGQVTDIDGDESDRLDETWALYDRQLLDDELFAAWSRFNRGVRILVLSDSCHSGSVIRALPVSDVRPHADPPAGGKSLSRAFCQADVHRRATLYEAVRNATPTMEESRLSVGLILISGCQDDQTSGDGDEYGVFTEALLGAWGNGTFRGTHFALFNAILELMPEKQTPNYLPLGDAAKAFEEQQALSIQV